MNREGAEYSISLISALWLKIKQLLISVTFSHAMSLLMMTTMMVIMIVIMDFHGGRSQVDVFKQRKNILKKSMFQ